MRRVSQVAQLEHRESASWDNFGGDDREPLMATTFVSGVELVAEDTMQGVSRPVTERCVDCGKWTTPSSANLLSTSPSSIEHSRNSEIRRRLSGPKWLLLTQGDHPCLRLFGIDTCWAASSGGGHQMATWHLSETSSSLWSQGSREIMRGQTTWSECTWLMQ